jgi:hypothetical protein
LSGFDNNSLCLKIIRSEDGSLKEEADLIFEIFGKGGLQAGTVILLGSLSDMMEKGSSGYVWEFVAQKKRIEARWPAVRWTRRPVQGCRQGAGLDNRRLGR